MTRALGMMLVVMMTTPFAHAEKWVRTGQFYPPGQTDSAPLFTQKIELESSSDQSLTSVSSISDPSGNIVMRETARIEKGLIVQQAVEQLQINEAYELSLRDGQVTYRTYKIEGSEKKLTEEKTGAMPANFVTGPGTEMFLKSKREQLEKAQSVEANFGIFEISRSVGFSFTQVSKKESPLIKIKMKVSSFFLSFVVDPIVMQFEPTHFHLVNFVGRTPVRIKKGQDWKPLDAEIVYKTKRVGEP